MSNLNELKRFEQDLRANEELRKKLDEAVKCIADAGRAESDGELLAIAAKELGYDVSLAALEQAQAEAEKLDPAELEAVSGGESNRDRYKCGYGYMYNTKLEDEYGHSAWCLTAWHCFAATLHTETKEVEASCWKDYKCYLINKDP